MSTVAYAHIRHTPTGVPIIAGTTIKVEEIVLDHIAWHWNAEEIHRNHPHLSLAQIYSALAYYYDHQESMDRTIEDGLRQVASLEQDMTSSPLRLKLKARGLM